MKLYVGCIFQDMSQEQLAEHLNIPVGTVKSRLRWPCRSYATKWETNMIKHHPSNDILMQFSEGNLPASLSIAVAIHVEMCPV